MSTNLIDNTSGENQEKVDIDANVSTDLNTDEKAPARPFISPWWGIYIILIIGCPLFSLLTYHPEPEEYGIVAPFVLQTQNGENFMLGQNDQPVIVNFIFTRCPNICPLLTAKMASLQDRIPAQEALFLSITVDPNYDKSEILKQYGQKFNADFSRWHFLTGDETAITSTIASFQQIYEVLEASDSVPNIAHSERFVLLDEFGHIRGFFDDDPEGLNRLVKDLNAL